jgi:hypothetical protein
MICSIKDDVFSVRVKWTNGVTTDCLLKCWMVFIFTYCITRKLDSYWLHFKQTNCQSESVIIVRENYGDTLSDLQHIQYRLLSLCETFCFAAVPTDRFTSTQLQQSLNSICSSQPNGHEPISWHEISCEDCELLLTDDYITAWRVTERIVRWCSSVTIQQQYMYLRHLLVNVSQ